MNNETNKRYKIPYKFRDAKKIEVYVTYNAYDSIVNDEYTNAYRPTKVIQDAFYKNKTYKLNSGAKMEYDTIYIYMWSHDDILTRHPSIIKLFEVSEDGKVAYHTLE